MWPYTERAALTAGYIYNINVAMMPAGMTHFWPGKKPRTIYGRAGQGRV